ncbi:unnamed protein product [Mytilus edulis]|uniref:MYND-type domain-containing protein n=1 Tax=Mytilus edulis TaxID=6550 RepID=A0A8S3R8A0_MYTED|nr:unnamed protein product [Mytilus edulis]
MQENKFSLYGQFRADKPLELEPIIVEIANAKRSQVVTPDLEDTRKRWLVVGICLHNVVAPVLRQYVSKSMNQVFNTLKQSHNIDTQCYPNHLECYPGAVNLNYEAINNNRIVRSGRNRNYQNYDYKIQNPVEFSKLYLNTNMAQYTGFDDTCDSSALLNIIMCSDTSVLGRLADQLRNDIRNPWAHCNFTEWDAIKYLESMQLMQQLIRHLHIPSEVKVLAELSHWEVNGINFLQGTRLGLEIVEEVNKQTQSLANNVCKRIDQTDTDLSQITGEVSSLRLQTDNIEKTVNENVKDIKDIKHDVENIKNYNSHQRPIEKVFFYPPDRISVFVGRKDKLRSLKEEFVKNKDVHHIEVICGLGGCGKTTLSIEFAWMFHQFYPGGVFWVSAESSESLENTIYTLAIDINRQGQNNTDIISGQLKQLLLGTWKRGTRGHIIITTRREPLAVEETLHVTKNDCNYLESLNEEEGVQFMIKRTEMFNEESNDNISKLVNGLGGLPLALEQAAAHIKSIRCSFKDYLASFEKKRLTLLSKITNPPFETNIDRLAVMTTWQLNMDYIRSQSKAEGLGTSAVIVMKVASFLFADDMPVELFNSGEPTINDEEAYETLTDPVGIKHTVEILTRFSLFQRYRSDSLSVHRLVQEVIRSTVDRDEKQIVLQCAIRMINKALMSTTTPHAAILKNKNEPHASRGLLNIWSKLAANANALKIYLSISKESQESKDLFISLESARVMQASAIYNSLSQRQDVALEDQNQMLNIMASLDIEEHTYNELTWRRLHKERDRVHVQNSIATILQDSGYESKVEGVSSVPLTNDRLREIGNQAFQEKRYEDALQYYTEALRSCTKTECNHKILSNRSLAYIKLQEYTYALDDANASIDINPYFWKPHAWKSYAIAELRNKGELPSEMEGSGIASASIAAFLHEQCLLEYKMKIHYPILMYKILDCANQHTNLSPQIMSIMDRPFTTYLLKKGRYTFSHPVQTTNSCQVIGVEIGVEIDIGLGIQISRPPNSAFAIDFEREREISVHFENILFCSKGSPVRVDNGGIGTFYRCKFSNQFPINEEEYKCEENIDTFHQRFLNIVNMVNKSYISSICSSQGGRIVLNSCEIRSKGGCGIFLHGDNSFLDISNCNVNKSLIGIAVGNGGTMTAFNNLICSHTLHGIAIGPHGTATLKGNTISQNKGDGIWCGGKTKYKEISTSKTMVTAVDNIIVQNGLSGICLEGGCFSLKSNTISDNWAWGIFIQDRSSVLAEGNDISCNKCGGIRVGMNYSASVILDGNTIKDHSGPAILAFNDDTSYDKKATDFDEVKVYSNQPIITDRNVRLYNDKPIQSPRNTVKSLKTCCGCQKMSTSLKACVKCRIASYCSRECQKSHWKRHQNMCPLLSEKYTIEIQMKDTQPLIPDTNTVGLFYARTFHPSLKGIGEGPSLMLNQESGS